MSDTTYHVRTVYDVQTGKAEGAIDRLGSVFDRIGGILGRLRSMLFGLPALVAAAFATGAVGAFIGRVTEVGSAAETARLALAGMINAQAVATAQNPTGNLDAALGMTDAVLGRMREHARALPGTFDELRTVFQGALSGGLSSGQSLFGIERLSADFMSVTKTLGIDAEQAGRDITLMLSGRAGAQVASFARLGPLIGKTAEEFNAMSAPERWQAIQRALAGFGPMIARYETSWDAVSSTAKDHLENLFRTGSAPLFDAAKDALQVLNGWLERNQARLEAMARLAGSVLAEAFQRVVEQLRAMAPLMDRLAASPVFAGLRGGLTRFAQGATVQASGGPSAREALTVGVGAVGLAAGLPGLGLVVAALTEFATHTNAVNASLASLRTLLAPVGGLAAALVGAFHSVAEGLGGLLAALAPGLFSGFANAVGAAVAYYHALVAALDPYLQMLGGQLTPVFAQLGRVAHVGGTILGLLIRAFGGLVLVTLRTLLPVFERVAGAVATVLEGLLRGIAWFNEKIGLLITSIVNLLSRIPGMRLDAPGVAAPSVGLSGGVEPSGDGWHRPLSEGFDRAGADAFARMFARVGTTTPAGGNTHVTNHVRVEQTIEQADDPDRVLLATRDAVLDAMLHPIQSSSAVVTR